MGLGGEGCRGGGQVLMHMLKVGRALISTPHAMMSHLAGEGPHPQHTSHAVLSSPQPDLRMQARATQHTRHAALPSSQLEARV